MNDEAADRGKSNRYMHREAGFSNVLFDDYSEMAQLPDGSTRRRNYAIIMARP